MDPQVIELFVPAFAFAFGAIIGSFLNVVIYRLPRAAEGLSISHPRLSLCPRCGTTIRGYDNIPLLSYFILAAKCRACRAPIPIRYFLIELMTACLFGGLALRYQPEWPVIAVYALLTAALISVSFIDIDLTIIPDRISIPGMLLAPLVSAAFPELHQHAGGDVGVGGFGDLATLHLAIAEPHLAAAVASLVGVVAGAAVIWLIGLAGTLMFRKEAMGFGDVKLFGMIGGYLGWKGMLIALLLACFAGAAVGIVKLVATRDSYIPFGPFLSLGAVLVMLWRAEIVHFILVDYPGLVRGGR